MEKQPSSAEQIVLTFLELLNRENFKEARTYVADAMTFKGVLGSRDSANAYFKDMEHMKLKYKVRKMFTDESDVCVFYDLRISGLELFGCGWYSIARGKITSLKVLFDPRPLLEQGNKAPDQSR